MNESTVGLPGVYIIYTMNSPTYPLTGVTSSNTGCLAGSKSGTVILSVRAKRLI